MGWAFPHTGPQVTLINPAMVNTMGGENLVSPALLLIKDAGGHLMETEGAVIIVITQKDNVTGLKSKTHQKAYISARAEDVVLSREAMETLGLVSNLDDRRELPFTISVQLWQMAAGTVQLQWRVGGLRGSWAPAPTSVARSSQLQQLTGTGLLHQMTAVVGLLRQMAAPLMAAVRRPVALKC